MKIEWVCLFYLIISIASMKPMLIENRMLNYPYYETCVNWKKMLTPYLTNVCSTTYLTEVLQLPQIFVSPELSSVRDYVVTHSVCSMCMYVCGILQNWSLYPHTLMYCHGTWTQWSLGRVTHVTSTDMGSKVI